jgi:hypothetical protein
MTVETCAVPECTAHLQWIRRFARRRQSCVAIVVAI